MEGDNKKDGSNAGDSAASLGSGFSWDIGPQAPAVSSTSPQLQTGANVLKITPDEIFPIIGEKLPTTAKSRGEFYDLGKMLGDHIGFGGAFNSPAEVIRDVLHYNREVGKTPVKRSDIPDEEVNRLLAKVVKQLHSPEFQFYQTTMAHVVTLDTLITKYVSKGKIGLIWYGLRSAPKEGMEGNVGYDIISKVEDYALGYDMVRTIANMVQGHRIYGEGAMETMSDIATNPAIQRQLQLMGLSLALPILADAADAKDSKEYFYNRYVKRLEQLLNVKEGDEGLVASGVNMLKGMLHSYTEDVHQMARSAAELSKDKDSVFLSELSRVMRKETNDVSKAFAATLRSAELLLLSVNYATLNFSQAIVYDMGELTLQAEREGRDPDADKIKSAYGELK